MSFTLSSDLTNVLSLWIDNVMRQDAECASNMRNDLQQIANQRFATFDEFSAITTSCISEWEKKVVSSGIRCVSVSKLVDKKVRQIIFQDMEKELVASVNIIRGYRYPVKENFESTLIELISSLSLNEEQESEIALQKAGKLCGEQLGEYSHDDTLAKIFENGIQKVTIWNVCQKKQIDLTLQRQDYDEAFIKEELNYAERALKECAERGKHIATPTLFQLKATCLIDYINFLQQVLTFRTTGTEPLYYDLQQSLFFKAHQNSAQLQIPAGLKEQCVSELQTCLEKLFCIGIDVSTMTCELKDFSQYSFVDHMNMTSYLMDMIGKWEKSWQIDMTELRQRIVEICTINNFESCSINKAAACTSSSEAISSTSFSCSTPPNNYTYDLPHEIIKEIRSVSIEIRSVRKIERNHPIRLQFLKRYNEALIELMKRTSFKKVQ